MSDNVIASFGVKRVKRQLEIAAAALSPEGAGRLISDLAVAADAAWAELPSQKRLRLLVEMTTEMAKVQTRTGRLSEDDEDEIFCDLMMAWFYEARPSVAATVIAARVQAERTPQ